MRNKNLLLSEIICLFERNYRQHKVESSSLLAESENFHKFEGINNGIERVEDLIKVKSNFEFHSAVKTSCLKRFLVDFPRISEPRTDGSFLMQ